MAFHSKKNLTDNFCILLIFDLFLRTITKQTFVARAIIDSIYTVLDVTQNRLSNKLGRAKRDVSVTRDPDTMELIA